MEFNDFAGDAAVANAKSPNADREFEAARPRAGWIEVEHTVSRLVHRSVGVAANDGSKSCGGWIEVQLFQIVEHVKREPASFNHFGLRKRVATGTAVDVSPNSLDGRNATELVEDIGRAYVTCMQDEIGAAQSFDCFRAKQAVRVRDYAENECCWMGHRRILRAMQARDPRLRRMGRAKVIYFFSSDESSFGAPRA